MKFVALLRGINVGGNALVSMTLLKTAFEKCGFTNVTTYINSGNVIFESEQKSIGKIVIQLEKELSQEFHLSLRVVVLRQKEFENVLEKVPNSWKQKKDLRCYIAFIKLPTTPNDIVAAVTLKEGVDSIEKGENVVYMTTTFAGLTKSGFTKLIGKSVYKNMTMRNYTTAQKLLSLLKKE